MAGGGEGTLRNQDGQSLGRKGQQTRKRLIDATERLLKEKPFSEIRPTDIAKTAGTSTTNFYLYFADAMDAILAVVEGTSLSVPEVQATLEVPWTAENAFECAKAFVTAYLDRWESNFQVLHVRTLLSVGGDPRFIRAELEAVTPLLGGLANKIAAHQAAGLAPPHVHPASCAAVVFAMLERMAAYGKIGENDLDIDRASLIAASASAVLGLVMGSTFTAAP